MIIRLVVALGLLSGCQTDSTPGALTPDTVFTHDTVITPDTVVTPDARGDAAEPGVQVVPTDGLVIDLAFVGATESGQAEDLVWLESSDDAATTRLRRGATVLASYTQTEPPTSAASLVADDRGVVWHWPYQPELYLLEFENDSPLVLTSTLRPSAMVLVDDALVMSVPELGQVVSIPRTGGEATPLAAIETPHGLATDGQWYYVIARLPAALFRIPIDGGEPELVTNWVGDNTLSLGMGPSDFVWSSNSSGDLLRAPRAGGTPSVVAPDAASMGADLIVTQSSVLVPYGQWSVRGPEVRRYALDGTSPEGEQVAQLPGPCMPQLAARGALIAWSRCEGGLRIGPLP